MPPAMTYAPTVAMSSSLVSSHFLMQAALHDTRPRVVLSLLLMLWTALAHAGVLEDGHPIVREGAPVSRILLSATPTFQERLAADEVRHYVERMTGAALTIESTDDAVGLADGPLVAIGRPGTHPVLRELQDEGTISVDPAALTEEGFVLKTTRWRGRPVLAVAGAGDVATLYAAYDLLERFGRVGFFRYEEHVPQRDDFVVPACDIRERPHFKVRLHGGQYHYFGIQWFGEEQWEENLRWYAKRRMNRTNYKPGPAVHNLVDRHMWKRLDLDLAGADEEPGGESVAALDLLSRMSKRGIQLGVRAPLAATDGQVSEEVAEAIREKYPETRFFKFTRHQSHTWVDPADPLWLRMNQAALENDMEFFGDTRLYGLPSPWTERSPGETPEEQERLTLQFANAVGRLTGWVEEKYPGGEWMIDGWAFANRDFWQPFRVKRVLEAIPERVNLVIWSYPAADQPTYEFFNYWQPASWAFIVMHSSGGNTTVHGDVHRIMGRTYRVLCEQRANNLVGYGLYTEANDYVPFFKDLVMRLAWNPFLDLDTFTRDYCERRYAPESVAAMVGVHELLLKSVYGPQSDHAMTGGFRTVRLHDPPYWFQLGANWVPFDELQRRRVEMRRHWPPLLLDALETALRAADRERGNPAYVRDLVDIMRSYIHATVDRSIWDAVQAAYANDLETFNGHVAKVERQFDALLRAINLVSDRWEFGVNALIEDFADAPLKKSDEEIRHYLYYVTFTGDGFFDYFRADRYEMIRDIYRPMTRAYLDSCRKQLEGTGEVKVQERTKTGWEYATLMDAQRIPNMAYETAGPVHEIPREWIGRPTAPPPPAPDAIQTATAFLAAARSGEF